MDKISARNSIIQVLMESHAHRPKIHHKSIIEDRKTKPKQNFSLLTKINRMAMEPSEKRFDSQRCSLVRYLLLSLFFNYSSASRLIFPLSFLYLSVVISMSMMISLSQSYLDFLFLLIFSFLSFLNCFFLVFVSLLYMFMLFTKYIHSGDIK